MSEQDDLFTKEELIRLGWKDRQIYAALDEADEFGPSGHWLNTTGKPFYDKGRAEIAAYRIGINDKKPDAEMWSKWKNSAKPTSMPLLAFNFHRLANACVPGVAAEFRSLRLSHPVFGRQPGTQEKEAKLKEEVIVKLVEDVAGIKLGGFDNLEGYLTERSNSALQSLGQFWRDDVVYRPALRSSYLSKGKSNNFMNRCIDVLALIHTGIVTDYQDQPQNIVELFIECPRIRFDRKSLN